MHRYLVRLENSKENSYSPTDGLSLLIKMRKKTDALGSVVKNLRVTEKAIEFDLYVPSEDSKKKSLEELELEFGRQLSEKDLEFDDSSPKEDKKITIKNSIDLFNEQRYWECHETLEQVWRKEQKGAEKDVQQGVILAASALVHHQKGEDDVCLGMIPRTLAKLGAWKEKTYYMLDVDNLKEQLENILKERKVVPFRIQLAN